MLYHIRIRSHRVGPEDILGPTALPARGRPGSLDALADLDPLVERADVVAVPIRDGAILSCQVPDLNGTVELAGIVAVLGGLGVAVVEVQAVPEPVPSGRPGQQPSTAGS